MSDNIIHANFDKFGILRSHFAQERPIQIMDRACLNLPTGQARAAISEAIKGYGDPIEQAWTCILFDVAVNDDLFIRHIRGEEIVYDAGGTQVVIPFENIFKASARVLDRLSEDDCALVWDTAEKALEDAARAMRS